ncbi:MAG TPA: tandem-95 repeat protein, partial [Candidatus Nitrosotalea sp.]|nr:tandem-95 repeat protein [Candidatus Nitrosotalea sp.]
SFTVGDAETPAASLTLTQASSNTSLLPTSNIVFGGSGAARTVILTPAANQSGTATITIGVSDGQATVTTNFVLTVVAVNDPPTISNIPDQTINKGTSTGPISFMVGDIETAPGSLALSQTSSNSVLVPTSNIVFGGSGANRTVTVTPTANQTGTTKITITVSDGQATATTSFVVTVNAVNTPPTITTIANQTISEDTSTAPISFTVGDAETSPGSLTLSQSSSNTTLVPANNIVFGGSGSNRTVTVTPGANQSGTTTISISVSDGQATVSTSFVLTVVAVNDAPTISSIPNQTINQDTSAGPISFTIGDAETPASSLTLTKASSNSGLVPFNNIVFGGSGSNRTVTVTPAAGLSGTATISISVGDGQIATTTNFLVTVLPVNHPPTITGIADQTIGADSSTAPLTFTIGDVETPAASLILSLNSSDTTVVPLNNIVLGGSGASRTVTVTPAAGQSGNVLITVRVSDGSLIASSSFVLTVTPPVPRFVYVPFEAEQAALASPMAIATNIDASRALFIGSSVANSGTATFSFIVPRADSYVIWSRALAPDSLHDSFYVSVDGNTEVNFATAQVIWTDTWQWTMVNDMNTGTDPQTFTLGVGAHTIVFRGQDAGTGLDQILVTNDRDFVPDVAFTSFAPNNTILPITLNANGSVTLSWPSVAGRIYRVQYKTSWQDPLWTILQTDVLATGSTSTLSDYVVGNRFYSVTVLP